MLCTHQMAALLCEMSVVQWIRYGTVDSADLQSELTPTTIMQIHVECGSVALCPSVLKFHAVALL